MELMHPIKSLSIPRSGAGISPLIWRRFFIGSDMSLATLHATLQIVFGWRDVHLHYFRITARNTAARVSAVQLRW